jgi:hypothetical protein
MPDAAQDAWVDRVLGVRLETRGSARPGGAAVQVAKGLLLWNSMRSYVVQQVKQLQQAILNVTADEEDHDEIAQNIGNLEELLELLDDNLSDKLGELRGEPDLTRKAVLSRDARKIVQDYKARAITNELFNDIDNNGIIPLDIRSKVMTALDAVANTI